MNVRQGVYCMIAILAIIQFLYIGDSWKIVTIYAANDRDFLRNKDAARTWGETYYKDWAEHKLNATERMALKRYTGSDYDAISEYLRKTEGNLIEKQENLPVGYKLTDVQKLNTKIRDIESALKKSKTPETIFVYRRVSEQQFAMESGELRPNGITIDTNKAKQLCNEFANKTFEQYNFMSTSLAQDPNKSYGSQRYALLLRIKIPKGTHAAYIGDISQYPDQLELLVQKGYTFKYDKFAIINERGRETMKIEASLLDKLN